MNSQSEHTTVPCPSCGQPIAPPVIGCPACGIRLTGPDAVRLWQVDQQLAALGAEREELLARLRTPGPAGALRPYPVHVTSAGAGRTEERSLTGQQVILGLGALLVLSAAALFTVVVWFVVGLVGQAVILAALTAVAVAGSRLLARRGLSAAAETAAAIAVGLTLIGASAVYALGLGDLDRFAADGYWSIALLVCGGLFVGFDRVVSSRAGDRGVWVYPPAVATVLSAAPWCVLSAFDVTGLALQAGAGIAAVVLGTGALLTRESAHRPSTRAAALLTGVGAGVAAALFGGFGFALAYDVTQPAATRYAAAVLLLAAVAATLATPVQRVTPALLLTTFGLLVPAVLLEVPPEVDAVAAIPLAAVSIALLRVWSAGPGAPAPWGWVRSLTVWSLSTQVVVFAMVCEIESASLPDLLIEGAASAPGWVLVLPAAGLLATSAVALRLFPTAGWVWAVQASLAATAWAALVGASATTTYVAALCLMAGGIAVAVLAARRAAVLEWLLRSERGDLGRLVDLLGLTTAACSFAVACGAAAPAADEVGSAGEVLTAIACYVTAAAVFVYAAQRGRLGFAYVGSLLTASGGWLLLAHNDVSLVEAYTLPPAVLLALVGAVTHRRARAEGRVIGSMQTMGPALAVALGPSTLHALEEGGTVRTVLVVAAALGCLLGGFGLRLKAPVLVGGVSLALVAVTEGGPYLAYVPGWLTIGAAGALLLAVGISWESAVVAGRRSTAWFSALR